MLPIQPTKQSLESSCSVYIEMEIVKLGIVFIIVFITNYPIKFTFSYINPTQ